MADRGLIASLRAAVAAVPDDVVLRLHLAELLLADGDTTGAVAEVSAVLVTDPGSEPARALMARALAGPVPGTAAAAPATSGTPVAGATPATARGSEAAAVSDAAPGTPPAVTRSPTATGSSPSATDVPPSPPSGTPPSPEATPEPGAATSSSMPSAQPAMPATEPVRPHRADDGRAAGARDTDGEYRDGAGARAASQARDGEARADGGRADDGGDRGEVRPGDGRGHDGSEARADGGQRHGTEARTDRGRGHDRGDDDEARADRGAHDGEFRSGHGRGHDDGGEFRSGHDRGHDGGDGDEVRAGHGRGHDGGDGGEVRLVGGQVRDGGGETRADSGGRDTGADSGGRDTGADGGGRDTGADSGGGETGADGGGEGTGRVPDDGVDWAALEEQLDGIVEPRFVTGGGTDEPAYEVERPATTLADVGGMAAVKQRLEMAFLAPMRNPRLRSLYRKSLRGGLLLYGPPGCGKTFLARALAGELGARFIAVGIAEVLDMYIGQSERNLHELFELARRSAPSVLFLDEVDALGQKRSQTRSTAMRSTVNQLLLELDSVGDENDGVFVLAATNQPWDVDPALSRPGRFDRTVLVVPPDAAAREAILRHDLAQRPVSGIDVAELARRTEDFSGADLAHLCETAAERALADSVRTGEVRMIGMADLDAALAEVRPSTGRWFESARAVAMFANEGGAYDDLVAYLAQRGAR